MTSVMPSLILPKVWLAKNLIFFPIPTKKLPSAGEFLYWCRLGDCLRRCGLYRLSRPAHFRAPYSPCQTPFLVRSSPLNRYQQKKPSEDDLFYWCRLGDLNARPTHYECVALPTELNRQCKIYIKHFKKIFKHFIRILHNFKTWQIIRPYGQQPAGTEFLYPLR